MSISYDLARLALDFFQTLRSSDVEWQRRKIEEINALKKKKLTLAAETQHELDKLKIQHEAALIREQEKQNRINKDYEDYLGSIDDMKQKMLDTYTEMPKPVAHIVHHQAREMLDQYWHEDNERARELVRTKLANLMLVVYEDAQESLTNETKIPMKTLEFIKKP